MSTKATNAASYLELTPVTADTTVRQGDVIAWQLPDTTTGHGVAAHDSVPTEGDQKIVVGLDGSATVGGHSRVGIYRHSPDAELSYAPQAA